MEVATGKTMTSGLDIYRAAKLFINRHGGEAVIHPDELLRVGDMRKGALARRRCH
jgi:hypothetical protein